MDGAPGDRIEICPFEVDKSIFFESKARRDKFRKYLGFEDNDIVVLIQSKLSKELQVEEVLFGIQSLKKESPNFDSYKFVFVGEEKWANDLKYLAFEMEVGKSVFFLHQNIGQFVQDLYGAADVSLNPMLMYSKQQEVLPLRGLDQLMCGVAQIGVSGDILTELLGEACLTIPSWNRTAIFRELLKLNNQSDISSLLNRQKLKFKDRCSDTQIQILKSVVDLIGINSTEELNTNIVAKIELEIDKGNLSAAEEMISRLEVTTNNDDISLSEVCRLKGDFLYSKGQYDESMTHFQKSLGYDIQNNKSYRGLGFIAWHGHAHDEALAFFKKALAIDQNDAQSMMGVGLIHKRVGLTNTALFWFEKSLLVDSHKNSAMPSLVQLCSECVNVDHAILIMERVIDTIGEKQPLMMCLGSLFLKSGRVAEGKMILNQALLKSA